jgi:hypothetical protein
MQVCKEGRVQRGREGDTEGGREGGRDAYGRRVESSDGMKSVRIMPVQR